MGGVDEAPGPREWLQPAAQRRAVDGQRLVLQRTSVVGHLGKPAQYAALSRARLLLFTTAQLESSALALVRTAHWESSTYIGVHVNAHNY